MAEADPEDRILRRDLLRGLHGGREDVGVRGIPGTVRDDHAVRPVAGDVLGGRVVRELDDAAKTLGLADDVHLHPAIDHDERSALRAGVLNRVAGAAFRDEVPGVGERHRADLSHRPVDVPAFGDEGGPHRPPRAGLDREHTGVHTAEAWASLLLEKPIDAHGRLGMDGGRARLLHDEPRDLDLAGFHGGRVHAVVPD